MRARRGRTGEMSKRVARAFAATPLATDADVAAMVGLAKRSVAYHRELLGIPKQDARRTSQGAARSRRAADIERANRLLGMILLLIERQPLTTDVRMASFASATLRHNVHQNTIARVRARAGIPNTLHRRWLMEDAAEWRREPTEAQRAIRKGILIRVTQEDGESITARCSTNPYRLGGHVWATAYEGSKGGCLLVHCQPAPPDNASILGVGGGGNV